MGCVNKTGLSCKITRNTVNDTGIEEVLAEITVYEKLKCYILKINNRDYTQSLAHETDNGKMLLKIWKYPQVEKGDILELTDKDLGNMGKYRIEDIDPKRFKGRLKSIYLYLKKYNG